MSGAITHSALAQFLHQRLRLDAEGVALVRRRVQLLTLPKRAHLLEQGEQAPFKAFVGQGVCRVYYTDAQGKENILFFALEASWLGEIESYHERRPSRVAIQAIEDCELAVIARADFEELEQQLPVLQQWYSFTAVKMYSALFDKLIESKERSVEQRYRRLVEHSPELLRRVPLQYIADYLEIEPQSLSRLRRRIQAEDHAASRS